MYTLSVHVIYVDRVSLQRDVIVCIRTTLYVIRARVTHIPTLYGRSSNHCIRRGCQRLRARVLIVMIKEILLRDGAYV